VPAADGLGRAPWADPVTGVVRVPPPVPPARGGGAAAAATFLAADWSARLGGVPVTVFTAAGLLAAGDPVARSGGGVRRALPGEDRIAAALADAMPGQLVPTACPRTRCDPALPSAQCEDPHPYVPAGAEYGALADGGSYERLRCAACGRVAYDPLPD